MADVAREAFPLWEQGLPAMNDIAVQLVNRAAAIAGKPCSHRKSLRHKGAWLEAVQRDQAFLCCSTHLP
ncbi:hypothetical protein F7R20_26410 [Pseudomonas brassicacearum subsp. brassicacearum]|nr:hypothetical protein F7R20_26410 [Pseudomonas brassicacearum subsp. brassicacearum]PJH86322.1 hypothetical protein CVG87_24995 [Pseudomonas sp. WCS365]QEO79257.1 hypothetical protein ELZ14_17470 [Pseudomonas brassicacearum]